MFRIVICCSKLYEACFILEQCTYAFLDLSKPNLKHTIKQRSHVAFEIILQCKQMPKE